MFQAMQAYGKGHEPVAEIELPEATKRLEAHNRVAFGDFPSLHR